MLTLDRYVTKTANRSILVVVLSLMGLISGFALFEELDESQVTYTFNDALAYVLRTMPRRLDEILAYGLFLGYLVALGRLAETNELTASRVSGWSPARIMLALTPSLVLWLTVSLFVSEYVGPSSERQAEVDKLIAQYGDDALSQRGGLWLRDDRLFMQVNAIDESGRIYGISQYRLDEGKTLLESISAEAGSFDPAAGVWRFEQVVHMQYTPEATQRTTHESWVWENALTPELLASQAFLEPNKMSMLALYRQMAFVRAQNLTAAEYELAFWARAMKPLTYLGLTLFALAIVLGPLRQVGMGVRLSVGVFAGIGFKYLQDLFAPTAIVFDIPPLAAVLIPIAIYTAIALRLIRKNA